MIAGCTLKMRTSSEIITVSKRAAKASGFSWGVSEEIGKNINLLEMFNLSGIENFNQYLKEKDTLIGKRHTWQGSQGLGRLF